MEQRIKQCKGSQKDFSRFMASEIEDFFPETNIQNKFQAQLNSFAENSAGLDSVVSKNRRAKKAGKNIKYEANFNVIEYWKQLSTTFNQSLVKFLDVKDMMSLLRTCKYFKEILDQDSSWKILQVRDFPSENLVHLKGNNKKVFSMKQYLQFLNLSLMNGIPYHTGYLSTFGSHDVAELSLAMVDFLYPQREVMKEYLGKILAKNQCKTFDVKLSWLKETNEICLWDENSYVELKGSETGNEQVDQLYPCMIKRYSMTNKNEEILEVFFLEDRYLVVKIMAKDEEKMSFRILNLEEEFHSITKGLGSVAPFDYIFTMSKNNHVEQSAKKFGVEFALRDQEGEFDMKIQLLQDNQAVFFTKGCKKPQLVFWDLKEKKQIGSTALLELKQPLNSIIVSKKPSNNRLKIYILDEGMNIETGNFSKEEGFVMDQNQAILIPAEEEGEIVVHDIEEEAQEGPNLTFGKKTRIRIYAKDCKRPYLMNYPAKDIIELEENLEDKTRRYYHKICERTCEEWLIVHHANCFYFVNLNEGKMYDFSSDKEDIGNLVAGNWTIYEDNLLIFSPLEICYYKISFEDKSIKYVFSRKIKKLEVEKVVKQWIVLDPCFTVLIFAHNHHLGFATRATVVVTSTQEFLYNQDKDFNSPFYKIEAHGFFDNVSDQWKNRPREIDVNVKFEDSKVFVSSKKAGFFFDMNSSSQPDCPVYLKGWMPKHPITVIEFKRPVIIEAQSEEQEELEQAVRAKTVNHMKLEGNPNTVKAKEKCNGWKNGGKDQEKREEDKEHKVLKGKGNKYHKNIRQNLRSDKMD